MASERDDDSPERKESVKYWEVIADNLKKRGWTWGCVSGIDSNGQMIWIADAHRDDGKRFVVHADEKLTAFVELGIGDSGRHRNVRLKSHRPTTRTLPSSKRI
jgi:hypothetical protein